jgi:hypothetical protein
MNNYTDGTRNVRAFQLKDRCYPEVLEMFSGSDTNEEYGFIMGTMTPFGDFSGMQSAAKVNGFEFWFVQDGEYVSAPYRSWVVEGENGREVISEQDFEKTFTPL